MTCFDKIAVKNRGKKRNCGEKKRIIKFAVIAKILIDVNSALTKKILSHKLQKKLMVKHLIIGSVPTKVRGAIASDHISSSLSLF